MYFGRDIFVCQSFTKSLCVFCIYFDGIYFFNIIKHFNCSKHKVSDTTCRFDDYLGIYSLFFDILAD